MGKKWEIFFLLGKFWDKKFFFKENVWNLLFLRFVKWVFIGEMIFFIFIINIGKNLVLFFK